METEKNIEERPILQINPDWDSVKNIADIVAILKVFGFQGTIYADVFNSLPSEVRGLFLVKVN